jgi:hypothetical protein
MNIRKIYQGVNPELLYAELKDFVQKQGVILGETKFETYTLPDDSSNFTSRGTLIFNVQAGTDKTERECLRVHILGSPKSDVRLMLDIDESLFPKEKISALQSDIDFIFGKYEQKSI